MWRTTWQAISGRPCREARGQAAGELGDPGRADSEVAGGSRRRCGRGRRLVLWGGVVAVARHVRDRARVRRHRARADDSKPRERPRGRLLREDEPADASGAAPPDAGAWDE